jgi:hypothetical protein
MHTDTWVYDYNSNTWSEMTPADNPSSMGFMAYDAESDLCIFHGGCLDWFEKDIISETWTYDYNMNIWTEINTNPYPKPRSRIAITYDSESARTILYSGGQLIIPDGDWDNATYRIIDDLWTFDTNTETWEQLYPPPINIWWLVIIGGGVAFFAIVILYFLQRRRE